MVCKITYFFTAFLCFFTVISEAASVRESTSKLFPFGTAEMNMVKNPNCKNTNNITDADSIVSRTGVSPLRQDYSCLIDADAASEFAEWDVEDFSESAAWLQGQSCEARLVYNGDASGYEFGVFSGSAELNAEAMTNAASPKTLALNFPCGDLVTDPKIRITSTDAGATAMRVAKLYIGPATNIGSVAQAEVVLESNTNAGQSLPNSSFTIIDFEDIVSDPYDKVTTGASWAYELPKDGDYKFCASTRTNAAAGWSGGETAFIRVFVDGAEAKTLDRYVADTSNSGTRDLNNCADVTGLTAGQQVNIRYFHNNGATINLNTEAISNYFSIARFPSQSEQVVKIGAPGQDWTQYTPTITASSGSLTNFTTDAYYKCEGRKLKVYSEIVFTGSVGTWTNPRIGLPSGFEIDSDIHLNANMHVGLLRFSNTGSANFFGLVRTTSVTNAVELTESDTTAITQAVPFTWASTDVLRAEFEVPVTVSSPCSVPVPALKYGWTTSYEGVMRTEAGKIDCDASPSIVSQYGDWLDTPTRTATGRCTVVFKTGIFSQEPRCSFTPQSSGSVDINVYHDTNLAKSSTAYPIRFTADSNDVDGDFEIVCVGPR